jgi:sulfate adenylyltransferase subunit 1
MTRLQSLPWKNEKKKDISNMANTVSTVSTNAGNTALPILDATRERGLLRFITAGSVDDGKSTLIGRLLFDSKGIFADQLDAMSRAKHKRTVGDTIDLSLLTDGLEAEREQGITIDVAYRYFATPKRKFIIADTPGHEQYTRNMVTGASTADAVIILIDVSKVKLGDDGSVELLVQTKRHSTIAHLLQIEHIIVAVNKMDLVNYDQTVYDRIVGAYQTFATQLGLKDIHPIPLSALAGDNVVTKSEKLAWHHGPTLIELLESLNVYDDCHDEPFRFPVQLVARHNGHEANDFRGYMGRIEAGKVSKGDSIIVQPSGLSATVKEILTLDGALQTAVVGQSVTILLNEYLDISRGDMFATSDRPASLLKTVNADLCWLSEDPLDLRRRYWLKHTSRQVAAKVSAIDTLLDINTQERRTTDTLKLNDIARVSINVQQALAADAYDTTRATGAFILIDEVTHQTVAAGMIRLG